MMKIPINKRLSTKVLNKKFLERIGKPDNYMKSECFR